MSEIRVILASQSPRRRELLARAGISGEFAVVQSGFDENLLKEKDPVQFAVQAAVSKARDVAKKYPSSIVIGADTVVSLDDDIIGKPIDYKHAKSILQRLSGTRHRVITGVALYREDDDRLLTGYEITRVTFRVLDDSEIEEYLAGENYLDKAGAYAIQQCGDRFVERIQGEYDNVVGLPVKRLKKLFTMFCLPDVEVEIQDIAFPHRWGVGRTGEGPVVFVTDGVYGERVMARILKKEKRFYYGEVSRIISPSPYRCDAACRHFGSCGGCAFQNLEYEKQVSLKEKYFHRTLEKIGGINTGEVDIFPVIHSPERFFYRNKMEFAFGNEGDRLVIGLRERHAPAAGTYGKRVVSLDACPIFSQVTEKVFEVVIDFARGTGLDAYDPLTKRGFFRHLVLREGKNTGQVMVILVTRSGAVPDMTGLADKLADKVPAVKSLWWVENDRISDVVCFEKKHHLYGSPFIEEKISEYVFRVYPASFFQPNTGAAGIFYQKVREGIQSSGQPGVLGLYSGAGPIEIFLSGASREVVGIESEDFNIANAEENCRVNNVQNCRFYRGFVEEVLRKKVFDDADFVVLDPPRAGLSGRALKNILNCDIPGVVYMSCNPAAFARDAGKFQEGGYSLEKIYCADFFPHTTHLEVLGFFMKN